MHTVTFGQYGFSISPFSEADFPMKLVYLVIDSRRLGASQIICLYSDRHTAMSAKVLLLTDADLKSANWPGFSLGYTE